MVRVRCDHDRTKDPNSHPPSYTNPRWTVQKTVTATATSHTVTTTTGCYLIEGDAKPIHGKICFEYGNSRWGILKKYHGTVLKKVWMACTLMSMLSAALFIEYKGMVYNTPPFSDAYGVMPTQDSRVQGAMPSPHYQRSRSDP